MCGFGSEFRTTRSLLVWSLQNSPNRCPVTDTDGWNQTAVNDEASLFFSHSKRTCMLHVVAWRQQLQRKARQTNNKQKAVCRVWNLYVFVLRKICFSLFELSFLSYLCLLTCDYLDFNFIRDKNLSGYIEKSSRLNKNRNRRAFLLFDNLLQDTCHTHATKCTDEPLSPQRLVRNISLYSKWLGLHCQTNVAQHDNTCASLWLTSMSNVVEEKIFPFNNLRPYVTLWKQKKNRNATQRDKNDG